MLLEDGNSSNIKLIDFGLARDISSQKNLNNLCSGTPFYIAPEVLKQNVSFSSDLWSLGVVMYICLSGNFPFHGNSNQEIFKNVLYKDLKIS
jgi:serine/threonine protein kinase